MGLNWPGGVSRWVTGLHLRACLLFPLGVRIRISHLHSLGSSGRMGWERKTDGRQALFREDVLCIKDNTTTF